MSDTYKAVFECPALGERFVWWVSSRHEARKHLQAVLHNGNSKMLARYRDNEWTLKIRRVFEDKYDVLYNNVSSWAGN